MLTESTPVNTKVEKKNNPTAARFREVRRELGFTQQQLADELLMSRNYIAKIEAGIQEPGPRALVALESLRVRLVNKSTPAEHSHAVAEDQAPYGDAAQIEQGVRRDFEKCVSAAEGDVQRLHWIGEQVKEHLAVPAHWKAKRGGMVRVTLPSQTMALSTETGRPIPNPLRAPRSA